MQTNLFRGRRNFRAKTIVLALLFCLFASQIVVGQAAIELSKLSPEQRQGLINELIKKGYTDLRDMPVAEAAERAGEIVGTMAMEAVLAKGVGIGLKGLSALKGTAFVTRIETLAQTAKQTIAEVKVPVKVTSEVLADTAGGTQKIFNVEKKPLGELMQNMESRAKEMLSGAEKVKAINLPSWEKLEVDMTHILSGHKTGGDRLNTSNRMGGNKDVFPEWMTENQISGVIKEAYSNAKKIGTQVTQDGKIVELVGETRDGIKIKMYVNTTQKTLDTAFPQWK